MRTTSPCRKQAASLSRLVAALAGLSGIASSAQAQEPAAGCSLTTVASLPLGEYGGWFTTPVSINGQPVVMMIDTGAAHSSVSSEVAAQLHLPQSRSRKVTVHGIGGEIKAAHPVVARDFRLGNGFLKDYDLTVINYAGGRKGVPGTPAGLLGLDLLSGFELEFDFPNRTLTLYTPSNCTGKFVPWTGGYETIEGQRQFDGQLQIPIRLNKVEINAVIDTGASSSALGIDTAEDVGVPESVLQSDRKSMGVGASGVPQLSYQHRFDSLTVGETTYKQVPLSVADEHFGVMQMILGMDFFRRRRLWVSFKTEQIFIQPASPVQADSGSR